MLDRAKVMQALRNMSDSLFMDQSPAYEKIHAIWQAIVADATFIHKVRAIKGKTPWLIPTWDGSLGDVQHVNKQVESYRILAVDGSQVYPDKHQGTVCFLINIGSVLLHYGGTGNRVTLRSVPSVHMQDDHEQFNASTELVNCMRQDLEFVYGYELSKEFRGTDTVPYLFLSDGSLIFWHLESKDTALKDAFLSKYLLVLHQLYQDKVLTAGYMSLPKNKELINLVKLYLCDFNVEQEHAYQEVESLVDTGIAYYYLPQYARSTLFENHASITENYPDHLRPYFFYLNVGHEIGRVEIPAWIAADVTSVDLIASIIIDQCTKGRGYPVALAEAHEQAVIKGPDREFFYQIIAKIGVERCQRVTMSQKSMKKRGIGI